MTKNDFFNLAKKRYEIYESNEGTPEWEDFCGFMGRLYDLYAHPEIIKKYKDDIKYKRTKEEPYAEFNEMFFRYKADTDGENEFTGIAYSVSLDIWQLEQ